MTTYIKGTDNSAAAPAVTGTDGDTGLFFPAANTAAISTGGSERLRIDSSGNVGIGTSSPGSKLTVVGSIAQSTSANGYDAYNASRASRSFCWGLDASGNYGIWDTTSGANNRLLIDSSGNVGIGTSSPAAKLDVSGFARFNFNGDELFWFFN